MTRENSGPFAAPRASTPMREAMSTSAGTYIKGTSAADHRTRRRADAAVSETAERSGNTSVKWSSSGGSSAHATASPQ